MKSQEENDEIMESNSDVLPDSQSSTWEDASDYAQSPPYVNCLQEVKSTEETSTERNLGAQIMQKEEQDLQKIKESRNLPDISLLDVDESLEDIEKERRRIIENQAVRAKRIDSWIKGFSECAGEDLCMEEASIECISRVLQTNREHFLELPDLIELTEDGEIVYDSILKNKEKTKTYWEKLMMAAELASQATKVADVDSPKREESVIERDIRIQREREKAFAQEREEALKLASKYERVKEEETLNSIPTTDEGNFSEYGSEEKQSLDGSRVMSPEVGFSHQRTPSYESMSSGHSSGSEFAPRRRSTVKPIDEPLENNILPFLRNQKETPIEREIRQAKEREDELRREKRSVNGFTSPKIEDKDVRLTNNVPGPKFSSKDDSPDKKPVNSQKYKDEIQSELDSISLKKCVSMSSLPMAVQKETTEQFSSPPRQFSATNGNTNAVRPIPTRSLSTGVTPVGPSHKFVASNRAHKGVMQRFIESKGRMTPLFVTAPATPQPVKTPVEEIAVKKVEKIQISDKTDSPAPVSVSRRYKTEDKIQMELEEMKKREAELRRQRAHNFGRSHPNLQDAIDQEEEEDDVVVRLPTMGKLRTALSNPNLIDSKPVVQKATPNKRRSALIDAWENRIRNEQ